ncbi:MAG: HAMP domain-containing histidine kinase [Haliscomenobacter sp.]|nr:HAMP domain-containing histidine kinase [Haliscomenobacter sp.]
MKTTRRSGGWAMVILWISGLVLPALAGYPWLFCPFPKAGLGLHAAGLAAAILLTWRPLNERISRRPWPALGLLLGVLGIVLGAAFQILHHPSIQELPLFGKAFGGIASPGWILAGLAGLFWWIALLLKAPAPACPKWIAGLIFPLLATAALAGFLSGLRFLVTTSGYSVAYENLLQAGVSGWTVFLMAGLGLLNLYLFSHWALQSMRVYSLELPARVLWFAAVSLFLLIPAPSGWTGLSPVPAALLGFSYLLLFDLFLDYRNSGLAWALVWALFFAGLSATMIARYRQEKDLLVLQDRAQTALSEGLPQEKSPTNRMYVYYLEQKWKEGAWNMVWIEQGRRVQVVGAPDVRLAKRFDQGASLPGRAYSFLSKKKIQGNRVISSRINKERVSVWVGDPRGAWVYADQKRPGIMPVLALFSLFFIGLLVLTAFLAWANRRWNFLPSPTTLPFQWGPRFRNRLQRAVLAVVLVPIVLFTLISIPYFRLSAIQDQENRIIQRANDARQTATQAIRLWKERGDAPRDSALTILLNRLSGYYDLDFDLYDTEKGLLRASSHLALYEKGLKSKQIPPEVLKALTKENRPFLFQKEWMPSMEYQVLYLPFSSQETDTSLILGVPFQSAEDLVSPALQDFFGSILMVSVFLLLITGSAAMLLANQLTAPLLQISEYLRTLKIGDNQYLPTPGRDDEIGELVAAYNAAVQQVEVSAEQLRLTEREKAWREMAKQVAHEIKNPLTPMKLSIQYLLHAYRQQPDKIGQLLPNAAQTLTEQIDGLAQIATAFSHFAQMPTAENERFLLAEAIQASVGLFGQQKGIGFVSPEEPVWVLADKKQIVRVFNNLLNNALQAIPQERTPKISISMAHDANRATVRVTDNGLGIPESVQDKVFSPNFTTKSSGMGLGLAMCKNMIQQAGGRIYFETEQGMGTTFFVELPTH